MTNSALHVMIAIERSTRTKCGLVQYMFGLVLAHEAP